MSLLVQMTKSTIITDAITYIEELKTTVEELSNHLLELEETSVDEEKIKLKEIDDEKEMKKHGIKVVEAEVEVNRVCGTKLWIRIVFQKKRGALTKLMEAITLLGIDLIDTAITTSRGAVLFTSFGQGIRGGLPEADQMKIYLLEIIRSI
ncbi:uncharacterized protein LOC125202725 isoform X1 [Salvia hispanica]|uniref:uncharacterized protein LOC125202725 isoform X1 n=1 Tax=Salvia hispanica TaxID=49212 RepID=UPI0020096B0D|nr:uncharacterized protein LOC125202725 isoform X1 [Salvia hispanica]